MSDILAQITAPHMCAGLVLVDARVTQTAPILTYMRGWSARRVKDYCDRKGWTIERVDPDAHIRSACAAIERVLARRHPDRQWIVEPRGYTLPDRASVDEALKVEADLLRSEGIDPAWPGFPGDAKTLCPRCKGSGTEGPGHRRRGAALSSVWRDGRKRVGVEIPGTDR